MKIESEHHLSLPTPQDFCKKVLLDKYAQKGERDVTDIRERVAHALAVDPAKRQKFIRLQEAGFVLGDQINTSAGTKQMASMVDSFVEPVGDAFTGRDANGYIGITEALAQAFETIRRGGAVGYDFSRIRPKGAVVRGTACRASGPVNIMRMFDAMSVALAKSDDQRRVQLGVLRVDHPDIEAFIASKRLSDSQSQGLSQDEHSAISQILLAQAELGSCSGHDYEKLNHFNLAVSVTDEFMRAVVSDQNFDLVHEVNPGDATDVPKKFLNDGREVHVYKTIRALDLWNLMISQNYMGDDLSFIYLDRVNQDNNLRYIEKIDACNPRGDQMLPAWGCSHQGALMLHRFVRDPFSGFATFDEKAFACAVQGAVEMLDCVLDKTSWPIPEQGVEATNKRRIGLGYLGLADAMFMLGIRYGEKPAIDFVKRIGALMRDEAYRSSIQLAIDQGPFPMFDADKYLEDGTFASRLPDDIKGLIRKHGIRNSHLLAIAPTGDLGIAFGDNASSGIDPISDLQEIRSISGCAGSAETFYLMNSAYRTYQMMHGTKTIPNVVVTAAELSVASHLAVLEAAAPLVDSAISKTVFVPPNYPLVDFSQVYIRAWSSGLKGISTHRTRTDPGAHATAASPQVGQPSVR